MEPFDLAVVGGGAAGFMTAITAAENGVKRIIILEGTSKLMEKVRISGGGRCNVTNATWIPNELIENYPRGGIQLLESFNRFAAGDVYDWFEKKGLKLKIEEDLRVFPVSNSSSDVIDCLRKSALSKNVEILTKFFVKEISKTPDNIFNIFSLKKAKVASKNIILFTPFSAAVIAVIKPAAPPPTTAKSKGSKNLLLNMLQSDNSKELQRKITPKTIKNE